MNNDLISRKSLLSLYDGLEEKGLVIPIDVLIQNIKDEPTSYDVDGVVERLTQESIKTLGITETQFAMDKGEYSSYCSLSLYDAIRIVKGGA